jgi:hypothetical protein
MAGNERGELFDLSDMGDEEIREVILGELRAHPNLDAEEIEVDVSDGRVVISGRVGTDAESRVASNVITDVVGATDLRNDLLVDSIHRGQRADGADDAAREEAEIESQLGDTGQHSDTAEHLEDNAEEEAWGTSDMQSAIRDGTSYSPPDHPTPDGYDSREEH